MMRFSRLVLGAGVLCLLAGPAAAQDLMAQNTQSSGTMVSHDSVLNPQDQYVLDGELGAKQAEVRAAETSLNINFGAMHTDYHENLNPGDDEHGWTGGFGLGASILTPEHGLLNNADLYTMVSYSLSAGNLSYIGHEENLLTGQVIPIDLTDRAVFQRIEGRLGLGFPLVGGAEAIPFLAGGYQAWNRNIDIQGQIGTDEQYTAVLLGGGVKLDVPVTPALVVSATAEGLAVIAGNIDYDSFGINAGLGGSAEEVLTLGADYDINGRFHGFVNADIDHFNYAGNKFTTNKEFVVGPFIYEISEPVSSTTQVGLNVGVAYSF
jgi:hypothetical protein